MTKRSLPAAAVVGAGLGMGFLGDLLLRAPGGAGLNVAALFLALAASVGIVSASGGPALGREARIWLVTGVLFGFVFLLRGSDLVRFFALVAAGTAFSLPALRAGRAWVRRASVTDLVEAVAASGLHAGLAPFRLLQKGTWESVGSERAWGAAGRVARSALVGALFSALPVAVFGALFVSADRVFAGFVGDLVRVELDSLASHLLLTGVLSWLASGYLAGFSRGTRLEVLRQAGWVRPSLKTGETAVALGLVDLLFLAFVAVQLRYLFGGHHLVEVTPGLTYAAYAREGFFQLVAAAALGMPWLLVVDALQGDRDGPGRWVVRSLAGVQLALLLAIVGSAVQRMGAYLDAYGLTESRIVAMTVLGWCALLILWFAATILRGRRRAFAFGALLSGFGLALALVLADPAAWAARSHLRRAAGTPFGAPGPEVDVDARYLASLGSDAAPVLAAGIDQLDATGRCLVARSLLGRWGPDRERDWRSWNRADGRAREAAADRAARLRLLAGEGEECEPKPEEAGG